MAEDELVADKPCAPRGLRSTRRAHRQRCGPRVPNPRHLSSLETGSLWAPRRKRVGTVTNPRTGNKPQRSFPAKARGAGASAPRGRNRTGEGRALGSRGQVCTHRRQWPPGGHPAPPRGSAIPNAPPSRARGDPYPSRRRFRHCCPSPVHSGASPDILGLRASPLGVPCPSSKPPPAPC